MFFRANNNAIDIAAEWRDRMAAIKGDAQIDDQLTFNQMVCTCLHVRPASRLTSGSPLDLTVKCVHAHLCRMPLLAPSAASHHRRSAAHASFLGWCVQVGTVWSQGPGADRFRNFYPIRAASADGRVIFDGNGTRRIHAIQANVVCSAHVYHLQQAATPRGYEKPPSYYPTVLPAHQLCQRISSLTSDRAAASHSCRCICLHLTFVEGWPKNPAKYWRLREAALMPVAPEDLGGRYLAFMPPQPPTIIPPERHESLAAGTPMPGKTSDGRGWPVSVALHWSPRLGAHLELIDRHIAALRNAIGMAKALGRQLIMPRMLCLCERAEAPMALLPSCVIRPRSSNSCILPLASLRVHGCILGMSLTSITPLLYIYPIDAHRCVLDGASTPVPHVCPLESVFDVARVEHMWQSKYIQLRPWTLLNATIHTPPSGQPALASDTTTVRWAADAMATPQYHRDKREVSLPRGLSDVELRQALASTGTAETRVLYLESAEGVFGGFEVPTTQIEPT